MSDDANDAAPADPSVTLCNWMIILTTLGLLGSVLIVHSILKDQYQTGWLS